jgi:hypothetical protein
MKKLTLLAAVFGLAVSAQAQTPFGLPFKAMGYDANLTQITGRMSLAENNDLDVGFGLTYDDGAATDAKLQFGASGFYLVKLHDWGPVDNYLALGGILNKLPQKNDNIRITVFGGFQPEVTLLDRLILSTRFGVSLDVMPDVKVETIGDQVSIVQSISFKLLF